MYRVEKRFTLPIGHRLSKNKKRCQSIHGHNFSVLVGIKTETLNDEDMVMDFSDLKDLVNTFLDGLDHCLVLNEVDENIVNQLKSMNMRIMTMNTDPTAERLSENLYKIIKQMLNEKYPEINMDYVTVFENENSQATYSEY